MADEVKKVAKVKKDETLTVYGTVASTHLETGKAYKMHPELAKKLITKGAAVKSKEEAEKGREEAAKGKK